MIDSAQFWDGVYDAKAATEVSWYQPRPEQSLALIRSFAPPRSSRIIDVGCGASNLIRVLAAEGYTDLTGLDGSSVAIGKAKAQLGDAAEHVAWIVADITRWTPNRQWDLWHDRAVFHFLVEPEARAAYVSAVTAAFAPGSNVIIATFAPTGRNGAAVCRSGATTRRRSPHVSCPDSGSSPRRPNAT